MLLKQIIYYGSYLAFPLLGYLVVRCWRRAAGRWAGGVLLAGVLLFVWARFVEPQIIIVRKHAAKAGFPARVALIADPHMGLYKGTWFLERVVDRLNALDVEVVLIAGDLTYQADATALDALFAPLARLRHKVYAVRGNHDSEMPGPPIERELRAALSANGVRLLENESVKVGSFTLVGLGDHWAYQDRVEVLSAFRESDNVIVLTHNPDTAERLLPGIADVTLAGHTHGGQIRIPWLYRRIIPTEGPFDRGWHDVRGARVFVTSGLGESGLPLRFLAPPVIDVIVLD